ncbi:LOW QUALITY PROTEIN: cilia- and flagella-associated protein 251-like [Salvelinus alpinus]
MSGIGTESNDPLPSPPEEQQAATGTEAKQQPDKDGEDLHQREEKNGLVSKLRCFLSGENQCDASWCPSVCETYLLCPTSPFNPSLVCRNFVLSTVSLRVVHVNAQGGVTKPLLRKHCEALHAVACHPQQPVVALEHSGILKVWDYERKVSICSRVFEKERQIQCIAYDPQGLYLAVGFASGAVHVLDACTQSKAEERLNYSQDCITHITFSPDSLYLATADAGKAEMVFGLYTGRSVQCWKYLVRHHSYYKPISDFLFGVYLDSTQPRLFSLGMDQTLTLSRALVYLHAVVLYLLNHEMEDFFYYCQLRKQGIDSMEIRQVSTRIPLAKVPFIIRALGFFPIEQEDMQNEVKFSRYAETVKYVTDIDLEEFIKVYVNQQPAFGISKK